MLKEGYTQVYTGDGKGKTTAAMGLAFRAAGDDMKVIIIQFLKAWKTGELASIDKIDNIDLFRFQTTKKFTWDLNEEEMVKYKIETREAYFFAIECLKERKCDILILDEVMGAIHGEFITEDEVVELINLKPNNMELVLTGRNVPDKVAEKADLITEMKPIKHYMDKGVNARLGIEF
ncbi:cob(I)yrinic acid a,c-diamide adenosyltransferase [uncultured Clostridium sp.]|jgi:cob(I)alamin adenosyltransferase|uniref:cob(I)yrinic acid a,c-diamide adenosyltransferase n=1 Tax=uncultured Clostridium sp. TaxID=59620 RepID=UPI002620F93E|nr:cob(I)yrinic acid a,c-diamide adenosyltransferase [uncultured Clostridium sp.]